MGSSMSKTQNNYNRQMHAVERHRAQKKVSKKSQRQYQQKPNAWPQAKPKSSFGKSSKPTRKPMPELNCWVAASGMAQNVPKEMLRSFKDHGCAICHTRVDPDRDYFVLHNCSKLVHDGCMRKWLVQFRDRHGRMSRPLCYHCRNPMNIRNCGKSRKNPLGFEPFNGR